MRLVRRALTLPAVTAALLAASLPVAPTAAAATSASCPHAASTRLFTGTVLSDPASFTKLWVYAPSTSQTLVCFVLPYGLGSGAIVVDTTAGVTPPTVWVHENPNSCPFEVANIQDPARVRIGYGRVVPTSVCLTVGNDTTTVTIEPIVGTDLPEVQIWRDGTGSALDTAACADLLAQATANVPGAAAAYQTCRFTNERLV